MHRYGDPGVSARFNFTGDPTQGDASIAVSELRGSDTATYQCKVKKAPGVDMRKVTLVVLGEGHFLSKLVLPVSFLTSRESGGGHGFFGGHAPHCVSVMQSDANRCSFQQFPCPHPSAGWRDQRRRAVRCPSAANPVRAPSPSATHGAERAAAPCRRPPPRVTPTNASSSPSAANSRLTSALLLCRQGERRAADQQPLGCQRGNLRMRGQEPRGQRALRVRAARVQP